jgi:hypothetical protein
VNACFSHGFARTLIYFWSVNTFKPEHIGATELPELAKQVGFARKPLKYGKWWYIVATHPSGQQEDVTGFHSEAEAEEWLAGSRGLMAWLKSRGYTGWFRTERGLFG